MVSEPFDNYLDLVEAARELNIHPQSLRRLIKQRKVPALILRQVPHRTGQAGVQVNTTRLGRKPMRRLL
jgi:hypothetical protein